MKRFVKNLEKLEKPAKVFPLKLDTNTLNKSAGEDIIKAIKEVMQKKPDLVALAAPQIGIDARIFVIRFNNILKTFINPIITKKKGITYSIETIPNKENIEYLISRPQEVVAVYYNEEFKYEENKFLDMAAKVFEQQCQLLDGILPNSYGMEFPVENNLSLKDAPNEVIQELVKIYIEWSKKHAEELKNSISEDTELNKEFKKLKFTEDVINGRSAVVEDKPKANPATKLMDNKIKKAENRARLAAFVNKKKHRKGK